MKSLRPIAILLALLMLLFAVSCGQTPDPSESTTEAPAAVTDPTDTTPETKLDEWGRDIVEDGLPADLKFTGETLKILSRSDASNRWQIDFYAKEETGVVLNDAVYARNERVKDRLGINISVIERDGTYSVFASNYAPFITNSYNSGDHAFDIVGTYSLYGAEYATNGYFANVNELSDYLDLSKVWWNQNLVSDMTINDTLYFVVGDINITCLTRMLVTFFNKDLMKNKYPDVNLYQTVIDGKWTVDYLGSLIADVYEDLNGNSAADIGDRYGVVATSPSEAFDGLSVSLDIPVVVKSGDTWVVNDDGRERFITAVEKSVNMFFGGTNPSSFGSLAVTQEQFASGQSYFLFITLDKATESYLTGMTYDYGILPNVKLDEDQENYYTIPQDAFNLISVMANVENKDMVAAALQLMCAETYKTVTPQYFEVVLKYRYARDDESGRMLDICREGLRMDFATINTRSLNGAGQLFRTIMSSGKDATSSVSATTKGQFKMIKTSLDKFLTSYGNK